MEAFKKVQKVLRIFGQLKSAGGLIISDSGLKYVKISDNGLIKFSLRLPPNIIEEGKIKDRKIALEAFKQLKNYIEPKPRKKVDVVVSLGNNLVYPQVFFLPHLSDKLLNEAADLNMQMISPIDIKQAYSAYQIIGSFEGNNHQIDLLAAFVQSNVVDDFVNLLKEADFSIAAVEFQSLSLVRALDHLKQLDQGFGYITLVVSAEGLDFAIIKNNSLYFDYFSSWKSILGEDRRIPFEKAEQLIISELERVMNFYSFRFATEGQSALKEQPITNGQSIINGQPMTEGQLSGKASRLFLLTQGLTEEIKEIIKKKFKNLQVEEVVVNNQKFYPGWIEALGAAVRGDMPRSKDSFITFGAVSVLEEYHHNQVLNMAIFWRNVFVAVSLFFFLVFSFSFVFFRNIYANLETVQKAPMSVSEVEEFNHLKQYAKDFNSAVKLIGEIKGKEISFSPFLAQLQKPVEDNDIRIIRIFINPEQKQVLIKGSALSPSEAFKFKSEIENIPEINKIDLPFASFIETGDNRVSFSLTIETK